MFKILVVEDDQALNRVVCLFLRQNGFDALSCSGAEEAYDALYESTCDLILSDIMMPGVDGFAFAATVRRLNAEIPLLFMSARDDLAAKQRGFRVGIDDYVERPVERILQATYALTQGDFSARIQPFHSFDSMNEFDVIIVDFNKMAEELSGTETLRTDFIANVSHELKTPLAILQNYATILQTPDLTEQQRLDYAGAITVATRRFSALITNILKLNKLENQQIFPDWSRYELSEQLCDCLLQFEDLWDTKNLQLKTELDEAVFIRGDVELLALVWNNLLANAIQFTDPNGTIRVSLCAEEDCALVCVSDNGCGISPEVGQHIFEKFYQCDRSHTTQGNGLGLALVRRVVDIMGGELSVESQLGQGSALTVKLSRDCS